MRRYFVALLSAVLLATGCASGVPEADYQAVIKENEELERKYKKLEQAHSELVDKELGRLDKEENTFTAIAWANTSFGDETICLTENPLYFQCIAAEKYSANTESVLLIWEDFKLAFSLLGTIGDEVNYEMIAIKYLTEDNATLIEFALRKEDGAYILDSIMGNLEKSSLLVESLSSP